jgi:steroid delta-isomerase-like uncharacterized protein
MSINEIKHLVKNHIAAISAGNLDEALAVVADDVVNHGALPTAQGAAGYRSIHEKLRVAFPDMSYRVEDVIAEGDRAVCRLTVTGTNTGPLRFSTFPLPATGKAMESEEIVIFRVAAGKIVEQWIGRDDMRVMRQLGQLAQAS